MAWKGIVRSNGWTLDELRRQLVPVVFGSWKPSGLVLHNTGAPNLTQWKGYPEDKRILNLERYYRDEQGWSAGPHFFIDDEDPCVWPFTWIDTPGTHSPSFNATRLGIEMVGDFRAGHDDPRSGPGLRVYNNTVAVFGMLCAKLGLEPNAQTIKFHREDPRTTHRCPGDRMFALKDEFIEDVLEYMGAGGDHVPEDNVIDPIPVLPVDRGPPEGKVSVNDLNLREESSASSGVKTMLQSGQRVAILGEAMNGDTRWLRVWLRDPATNKAWTGWVAARFVIPD